MDAPHKPRSLGDRECEVSLDEVYCLSDITFTPRRIANEGAIAQLRRVAASQLLCSRPVGRCVPPRISKGLPSRGPTCTAIVFSEALGMYEQVGGCFHVIGPLYRSGSRACETCAGRDLSVMAGCDAAVYWQVWSFRARRVVSV